MQKIMKLARFTQSYAAIIHWHCVVGWNIEQSLWGCQIDDSLLPNLVLLVLADY